VPLPSRFDIQVEYERAERWRQTFHERLAHCYRDWAAHGLPLDELIGHTIIPYSAYWSFGEDLPVLSENVREPSYISYRFATLAALLIQRLENTELLVSSRDSYVDAAVRGGRRQDGFRHEIAISHSEETAEPARRLADLLRQTGIHTVVMDEPVLSSWKDQQRVLDDSRHLVMVLGEKPSPHQDREAQYFLRQTLDEGAERRLIPIVTTLAAISRMPHLLQSFQSYDLSRGSLEDAAREIARAFGDERSRSGYP